MFVSKKIAMTNNTRVSLSIRNSTYNWVWPLKTLLMNTKTRKNHSLTPLIAISYNNNQDGSLAFNSTQIHCRLNKNMTKIGKFGYSGYMTRRYEEAELACCKTVITGEKVKKISCLECQQSAQRHCDPQGHWIHSHLRLLLALQNYHVQRGELTQSW